MKNSVNIKIKKLIIHILDNQKDSPKPLLSDNQCQLSSHITDFFVSHIEKSLSDDKAKIANFSRANGAVRELSNEIFTSAVRFVQNSRKLAELLFTQTLETI